MNWWNRWRRPLADRDDKSEVVDPEIERLLARARSLPRNLEPQRDLWSGIENQINTRAVGHGVVAFPSSGWLATFFPRPLAASVAAIFLVATTAVSVLWLVPPSEESANRANAAVIAERLRERDGVADVRRDLLVLLEVHRDVLPADTLAVLDENLRSIDRAIAEIHMAFELNPDHHALGFLLAETYRSEADLLERLEEWLQDTTEVTS